MFNVILGDSSTSSSDIEDVLYMFHVILGGSSTSSSDIEDVL
jgi:hypothetical protein